MFIESFSTLFLTQIIFCNSFVSKIEIVRATATTRVAVARAIAAATISRSTNSPEVIESSYFFLKPDFHLTANALERATDQLLANRSIQCLLLLKLIIYDIFLNSETEIAHVIDIARVAVALVIAAATISPSTSSPEVTPKA